MALHRREKRYIVNETTVATQIEYGQIDKRFSLRRHNSSDESVVLSEPSDGSNTSTTASCSTSDDSASLALLGEMPSVPSQDPSLHWEPFAP